MGNGKSDHGGLGPKARATAYARVFPLPEAAIRNCLGFTLQNRAWVAFIDPDAAELVIVAAYRSPIDFRLRSES